MADEDLDGRYASQHTLGDGPVPEVVVAAAGEDGWALEWRNELGGLTFRIGDRFLKWNPRRTGVDLRQERDRLEWLAGRHPVPEVVGWGEDDDAQWLLTAALPGGAAVGPVWRARPSEAVAAIAAGLRAIHAVAVDDVPGAWRTASWVGREPAALGPRPRIEEPVLVHGDACAPNTLVDDAGRFVGHVDLGDLAAGDRWADLAIASMSLDWNFGEGDQEALFAAYGVERDDDRIAFYRALWDLES
jgi:kanamycin kinase